jgi:hypothetical protein
MRIQVCIQVRIQVHIHVWLYAFFCASQAWCRCYRCYGSNELGNDGDELRLCGRCMGYAVTGRAAHVAVLFLARRLYHYSVMVSIIGETATALDGAVPCTMTTLQKLGR